MFSNLRYLATFALAVLVVLTILAGIFLKHTFVSKVVEPNAREQAQIIANTFINSIWNRYYPVIGFLSEKPTTEWEAYPQFVSFMTETSDMLKSKNLIKAEIYGINKERIFDSNNKTSITPNSSLLGKQSKLRDLDEAFEKAKSGQTASVVSTNAYIKSDISDAKKSVLRVFIPIRASDVKVGTEDLASKSLGIAELNIDITEPIKKVETIQFMIIVLIVTTLSLLTGGVLVASQKAETIIEKQQEASMEMSQAKTLAESESKAKSQFLANVSHELRTPLNAIIGFSEIISSESMGPLNNDQYKEFIKDIHTSGVHLLSLINDILDFSKAEEDKLQVDFEPVDVTKLAKICVRMVTPRAEEAKVKLLEELPTEHLIVNADPKRLKQAVLNLLSNAVKFTPEGGDVSIKVWKDTETNSNLHIEIRDTGVGMAAQDLARALSPFGQVDNKLSRRYEGTGLGLPLTKKLVELMKGKFEIKSEPSLGTTVTLIFNIPTENAA